MKNKYLILLCCATLSISSCRDFLNEKSDSSLTTPVSLEDNQALLDRLFILGLNINSGEISSDDFYVIDQDFSSMANESEKRLYTWQPDYVAVPSENDWANCFQRINVFNTVLYNLNHYEIQNADNVRGQALVFRASAYLEATQIWCLAYDSNAASNIYGLPLRLDPDMSVPSVRSTLEETYNQIIEDLQTAVDLLPVHQIAVTRPSKVTALGYLARAYLYKGDYQNALKFGKKALELQNQLLDFNSLNPNASYPIASMNVEVLLHTSMAYSSFLSSTKAKIPLDLYNSYDQNDLRKSIFFKKNAANEVLFKGNYSGSSTRMTCLAIDELYLIVAESYAQTDDVPKAMRTLNDLLIKRFKVGTFTALTANSKKDALKIIRQERRKEILFRGLRWADLKRYNREGAAIDLSKNINGQAYSLPPNDLRYAIAIPEDIIVMTGMPQNKR